MPRHARLRLAGIPFHVIQRGNNRSNCFFSERDYGRYLAYLQMLTRKHRVAVHAYVLMTNHVHLLMTPEAADGIGLVMKFLGQLYVQYVNRAHERSGSLWEGRFRSCLVDNESYALRCHSYIENNPVRAGMVGDPGDYPWSSYRANALGHPDALLALHPSVEALARSSTERQAAYRKLFADQLDPAAVAEIRAMTNGGYALGSEAFRRDVASALGRPVSPRKSGPKPRPSSESERPGPRLD